MSQDISAHVGDGNTIIFSAWIQLNATTTSSCSLSIRQSDQSNDVELLLTYFDQGNTHEKISQSICQPSNWIMLQGNYTYNINGSSRPTLLLCIEDKTNIFELIPCNSFIYFGYFFLVGYYLIVINVIVIAYFLTTVSNSSIDYFVDEIAATIVAYVPTTLIAQQYLTAYFNFNEKGGNVISDQVNSIFGYWQVCASF